MCIKVTTNTAIQCMRCETWKKIGKIDGMEEMLKQPIKVVETIEFYCRMCLMAMLGELRERVRNYEAITESSAVKEKSESEVTHKFVERLKI